MISVHKLLRGYVRSVRNIPIVRRAATFILKQEMAEFRLTLDQLASARAQIVALDALVQAAEAGGAASMDMLARRRSAVAL